MIRKRVSDIIRKFLLEYSKTKKPIEISFKEILKELNKNERATHLIHRYPAKLLMHIPYFFVNNNIFSKEGDTILDPFCGSGTTLLEAVIANRNALGVDSNPVARLISEVKTTTYDLVSLEKLSERLKSRIKHNNVKYPDVVNIDYWFLPTIKDQLASILTSIKKIKNSKNRNFFLVCFSNCIKKVSLANPKIIVPVRLKYENYPSNHPLNKKFKIWLQQLEKMNVYDLFFDTVSENIQRISSFISIKNNGATAEIISSNARNLSYEFACNKLNTSIPNNSIDMIITSPPYAGAQKYIRATSLNLGWLELANSKELIKLKKMTIGRENYNRHEYNQLVKTNIHEADLLLAEIYNNYPLRAHIAANYLIEMEDAFRESVRVLKPDGYFVLIAGHNNVCGREFKTYEYLLQILNNLGLKIVLKLIDDIKSYGLMTKRNKTASIITREWILVLKK